MTVLLVFLLLGAAITTLTYSLQLLTTLESTSWLFITSPPEFGIYVYPLLFIIFASGVLTIIAFTTMFFCALGAMHIFYMATIVYCI